MVASDPLQSGCRILTIDNKSLEAYLQRRKEGQDDAVMIDKDHSDGEDSESSNSADEESMVWEVMDDE